MSIVVKPVLLPLLLLYGSVAIAQPPMPFDGMARAPRLVSGGDGGTGAASVLKIEVGSDGRPINCAVTGSSGDAEADSRACRTVMSRFRYEPAVDGRGRPMNWRVTYRYRS